MNSEPLLSYELSHKTSLSGANPLRTLQVYIHRPNTQQSVIDFHLPLITNNQGNLNDSTIADMEFMLTYHEIEKTDSALIIEETTHYVMNILTAMDNNIAYDLQVTLNITDYNQNATARLDVDLIITDIEETNRHPTTEEENDTCTICFGNYNNDNGISSLTCGHTFHFLCIDQWLRTNISCPICRESDL